MSTEKKTKKRGRGRPKGSTVNGPTVQISFRLPKALFEQIESLRTQATEQLARTTALAALVRKGLERTLEEEREKSRKR